MNTPLEILKRHWGFNNFRVLQKEIIDSVINNKDSVALLPTGGGKSLCFQIPTLIKEGICIVISPLIALMEDQVASLNNKNIKATYLKSGTTQDELITIFDNIRFGRYKFLYLSPERLRSKFIQEKIKQLNICLIAIDEAHCISQWGHDFRPAYREIGKLREISPQTPIIALTATATNKVIEDITTCLKLNNPEIFRQSFSRKNLYYQVINTEDKLYKLKQIITKINAPTIIYVNSRSKTKQISAYLNNNGIYSSFYHGGLSSIEKQINFEDWKKEKTKVMVATNAFGMGIDKQNVRIVIHYNIPSSIEDYTQESGRAGRDENKAFSVILTNTNDILSAKERIKQISPSIKEVKFIYKKLFQHFQIAKGELITSGLEFNFLEFCNKYKLTPKKVFTTLQLLENFGIIEYQLEKKEQSTIQFLSSPNSIYIYSQKKQQKTIVPLLLRMYGGLFENQTPINEFTIASKAGITSWQVINQLEKLEQDNIIDYKKKSKHNTLFLLHPREDDKTINRVSKLISEFILQKEKKLNAVINFINNNQTCRNIQILNYFNEKNIENCNNCDVCYYKKKSDLKSIERDIKHVIKQKQILSSKQICELLKYDEKEILIILQTLLMKEEIGINKSKNYYTL